MSLLASFMSAITILGTPAEIYVYGTQYWIIGKHRIEKNNLEIDLMIGISYIFTIYITATLFMPMFVKLEVTSAYEVMAEREILAVGMIDDGLVFRKTVRSTCSISCIVDIFNTNGKKELFVQLRSSILSSSF